MASGHPNIDRDLASLIDHTELKPDADRTRISTLCDQAVQYGFWSVCVNPYWVPFCVERLAGTNIRVCTVVGFPLGATTTAVKAAEAAEAVKNGSQEVDMVINVGALKSGDKAAFLADMKAVKEAVGKQVVVKAIIETCLLTEAEKMKACELAREAGVDFVKTSTGFGSGGATVEDVALMRRVVGPDMGVKASGGIRDRETALAMIKAGANRIGASASVRIVTLGEP